MPQPARTLCLGEVLVDLICERAVGAFGEASSFSPHFGGATANVAVSAARHGVDVGLAGAVGADPWGDWLRDRLRAEGVDVRWLAQLETEPTPVACIAVDPRGEPTFTIYGEALEAAMAALAPRIGEAIEAYDALFFGSNTLAGPVGREVTERARKAALAADKPVIIDANLRLARWRDAADAATAVRACAEGALLLRANKAEAELLSGRSSPSEAALALRELGARAVVVTLGADGALLALDRVQRTPGVTSRALCSTVGAGDALTGVLLAALTRSGYDVGSLEEALPLALAAGTRATERWGAID